MYSAFRPTFMLSLTVSSWSLEAHRSLSFAVYVSVQTEYVECAEQCMNFACELMDLCRGTQEVEAVLGEETSENQDPLARLRLAIQYNEKKVNT